MVRPRTELASAVCSAVMTLRDFGWGKAFRRMWFAAAAAAACTIGYIIRLMQVVHGIGSYQLMSSHGCRKDVSEESYEAGCQLAATSCEGRVKFIVLQYQLLRARLGLDFLPGQKCSPCSIWITNGVRQMLKCSHRLKWHFSALR